MPAAGVFTSNLACAAPVQVSRAHLHDGRAAAVVVSSGNANAATGEEGRRNARRMCELSAEQLGPATDDVLVCSTGLIGIPLPMAPLERGIPAVAAALAPGLEAGRAAAEAMLTTDTRRKEALAVADLPGGARLTVGGMAKGAAMLAPAMATMLAVLTTDAAAPASVLHAALEAAVARRSTRWWSTAARARTTPCCSSRVARPARPPMVTALDTVRSSMRSPRCATSSRRRWHPTPKGRPSSRGSSCEVHHRATMHGAPPSPRAKKNALFFILVDSL